MAAENPDAIITLPVDIDVGLKREDAKNIVEKLGFSPKVVEEVSILLLNSYYQICQNLDFSLFFFV